MKTYIAILAAFLFLTPYLSQAQNGRKRAAAATGDWVQLASKTVNFNTDRDYVYPSGNDWYTKIYFKVTEAPIQINSIIVHFENDETPFNVSIRSKIQEGGQSRVIDLPAGQRRIKKIELSYETLGSNRGRANIAVWGRR